MKMLRTTLWTVLTITCLSARLFGAPTIAVERHKPCNVFSVDDVVRFEPQLRGFPAGEAEVLARVTNYFGEQVWTRTQSVQVQAGKYGQLALEIGKLEPGYYELNLAAKVKQADGKVVEATEMMSFGTAGLVNRSAEEVRKGGYRFGLKKWNLDKAWWRGNAEWHEDEAVDACVKLGLQWTRETFNTTAPSYLPTVEMINRFSMNVVLKIEGFPEECYDTARYGPREEWVAKHKSAPHWNRWTVPQKEPYQRWLRAEIEKIPASQVVFEIGNEPWGRITPEEFAELCRMIVPVVKELRPTAIIGPDTAMGNVEWEDAFIRAGGMNGMDMVTLHPYSFSPPPEIRTRLSIRNYRDWMRAKLGRDVAIYVTEYGWSTAPQDRRKQAVSERQQAQRTTRQSLMLYAEDMKVLIPHWMADREHDVTDREHWFGFFRLAHQPKPVLMAHAACARMIDGGRFVGDLWYGPGVGAMLFERGGIYTAALWTMDEAPGTGKDLSVDVGVPQVTQVDIMGREKAAPSTNGKVSLRVNSDVTYLVGVSPDLAKQAMGPDQELRDDQWLTRDGSISIRRATAPPTIDGKLADWSGVAPIELKDINQSNPSPANFSAASFVRWDADHVYAAFRVRDDRLTGAKDIKTLGNADYVELAISTRPTRQPSLGGWMIYDYTLQIAPTSADDKPTLRLSNSMWKESLVNPSPGDASGVRWALARVDGGWEAEVAIPMKLLGGFPKPVAGTKGAFSVQAIDVDEADGPKLRLSCTTAQRPQQWPYLVLAD